MKQIRAEIIAIGDEIISGQTLDTNCSWISQQLCDHGIETAFHSTVGDRKPDKIDVFSNATQRANVVVVTGGLGPTADDLTREVLSVVSGRELEFHQETLDHIESVYAKFNRVMPEQNRRQAWFPAGSKVIPNPEGTAPGIDLTWKTGPGRRVRFFCLPGVPAELRQMWHGTVADAIRSMVGHDLTICHRVLKCFGRGESTIEKMLGPMIERGRDPSVGITASHATISLRISGTGKGHAECLAKLQPTVDDIRTKLGTLVFAEGDQTMAEVLTKVLSDHGLSLAIHDFGLGGAVASSIYEVGLPESISRIHESPLVGSKTSTAPMSPTIHLDKVAQRVRAEFSSDLGVAIGPVGGVGESQFNACIASNHKTQNERFTWAGHTSFRHQRSVKQVLNMLRLFVKNL